MMHYSADWSYQSCDRQKHQKLKMLNVILWSQRLHDVQKQNKCWSCFGPLLFNTDILEETDESD